MTERQLEERLRAALEHAAPNDVEGVLSRCAPRQGGAIPITAARASPKKHRWAPSGRCRLPCARCDGEVASVTTSSPTP